MTHPGHLETVRALVELGVGLEISTAADNATAIFIAAQNNHEEVVRTAVSVSVLLQYQYQALADTAPPAARACSSSTDTAAFKSIG